jgi:hydrogenase maturation factor
VKIGKFSSEKLDEIIISKINHKRSEVVLSANIGEDCAAIDLKDRLCVVSTDPITGAVKDVGRLSVHVSVNDVASSGAEPVGILVTILAPPSAEYSDIEAVIEQVSRTCDEMNLDIVGGHTEVTDAVNRIVLSTTVLGQCAPEGLVTSSGAGLGDSIIVTKYIAQEGTAIIANDYEAALKDVLTENEMARAKALIGQLSVLPEGRLGAAYGATAMHDVTEGGIFGAVYEVCESSGTGALVETDAIPMLDETKKICERFSLNPYRLISSGSMLITIKEPKPLMDALKKAGVKATLIGKITDNGIRQISNGEFSDIEPPMPDELFKLV